MHLLCADSLFEAKRGCSNINKTDDNIYSTTQRAVSFLISGTLWKGKYVLLRHIFFSLSFLFFILWKYNNTFIGDLENAEQSYT